MLKSLLLILLSLNVFSAKYENMSILTLKNKVQEMNKKYGSTNVLVVFDIDNTLLSMPDNLGSDQWFSWQINLMRKKKKDLGLIASSFKDLLDKQKLLFYKAKMRTPEDITSKVVRSIQDSGNKVIALTSRAPQFNYVTIRELLRNKIQLESNAPKIVKQYLRPTKAYELASAKEKYALVSRPKRKAKKVLYQDGVFYTAGLNKGVMLKILLKEANLNPKVVIFMDDKKKHIDRVEEHFKGSSIETYSYRYGAKDQVVRSFHASDKLDVISKWDTFNKQINTGPL